MSTIDLYQVLKEIPNVTDEQAKNAADSAVQSGRLDGIEEHLAALAERVARVETSTRTSLGLQVAVLLILLAPLV